MRPVGALIMMTFICTLMMLGGSLNAPEQLLRLLEKHGWGQSEQDASLSTAAEEIARIVGSSRTDVPSEELGEHLSFVLTKHGISDAQIVPYTLKGHGPIDWASQAPKIIHKFKRHVRPTHYGHAVHRDGENWTVTFLFVHRGAVLSSALPRSVKEGEPIRIEGTLRRGYFEPRLIVKTPQGQFGEGEPKEKSRDFSFLLNLGQGDGVYDLELVANSRYGPTVLIQHQIFLGEPLPTRPTVRLRPSRSQDHVVDLGIRLLSLVNAHRVAHDMQPLKSNEVLAKLSEAHAREMHREGRLTHGSPKTGTLTTRVREVGLKAGIVAENLAEARDERAAFRAFLDSPGHARNLLLPEMTHIGIGVVGRYFAVTMCQCIPDGTHPPRLE